MKFDKTAVWGFEHAIRGMRNPMNSHDKSDSRLVLMNENDVEFGCEPNYEYIIGENDTNLAQRLIKGGSEHRKFLRQIFVSVDITAPLYWWKEFDTYKISTTANSTSTMHKIHSKEIEVSDFSIDDFDISITDNTVELSFMDLFLNTVTDCETLRKAYMETGDKRYWKALIQLLPASYNQKRTVTMTYENLRNMYFQRKYHKLNEWSESFIRWVESLPYAKELIMYEGQEAE